MKKVLDQYISAVSRQLKRRNRQGREQFTAKENKAIMYYGEAAQQLKGIIDAPKPAWVDLQFGNKSAF